MKEVNVYITPGLFPLKRFAGITLWPFGIYFRTITSISLRNINHEKIHWCQQKEMLGLFFYLWYFLEWFIKLFQYGRETYRNIGFEREAYKYMYNPYYLENRKKYHWLKFVSNDTDKTE